MRPKFLFLLKCLSKFRPFSGFFNIVFFYLINCRSPHHTHWHVCLLSLQRSFQYLLKNYLSGHGLLLPISTTDSCWLSLNLDRSFPWVEWSALLVVVFWNLKYIFPSPLTFRISVGKPRGVLLHVACCCCLATLSSFSLFCTFIVFTHMTQRTSFLFLSPFCCGCLLYLSGHLFL